MQLPLEAIHEFCERWKIQRLEVFGSMVHGDFGAESDLDFLYTLGEDARIGWDVVTMADELSEIVGRPVDLVSRHAVEQSENPFRKRGILGSAEVVYGG